MLKLENIVKKYYVGSTTVEALKGVSIEFRKSEFVAVLGHSGCGKTTLLNIIGGLDRYTSGKLTIAGRPTEHFSENDWDAYRNHSVGFVFQTYNLIPHQTVLSNVELALTLSGVSKTERRRRAMEALEKVGLKGEARKKPNQMSGGQMQRVAIARALVNDPEILLADEPTGALDSETSVQIMDILKEIASDRLVIMVTHNPELAEQYATRTVRLSDGVILSDSDPYDGKDEKNVSDANKTKHTTMSFFTALALSFNNLMTKKGRTILTAFAGSIGIIGIALILALSNGIKIFIDDTQEETLTSYPVVLYAEEADMSSLIESLVGSKTEAKDNSDDAVYVSAVMYDLVNSYNNMETKKNDLKSFKSYMEQHEAELDTFVSTVQYSYNAPVNIYVKDTNGEYAKADMMSVFSSMTQGSSSEAFSSSLTASMQSAFSSYGVWEELLAGEDGQAVHDMVKSQYTLLSGTWPSAKDEIILFLDNNNEITDITLYALGLMTSDEMIANMIDAKNGKEVEVKQKSYSFEEIMAQEFRLVLSADYYSDTDADGIYTDIREDEDAFQLVVGSGLKLHISGIAKSNDDSSSSSGSLGYTSALVSYIMEETEKRDVVKAQQSEENKNKDIFTGLPFEKPQESLTDAQKSEKILDYFSTATEEEKYNVYLQILSAYSEEELSETVDEMMSGATSREALEEMILQNYAGSSVDEETLKQYIAAYSDEELHDMVAKAIFDMLVEKTKAAAETKLAEIAATPSEEELTYIASEFLSNLTDRAAKVGYVYQDYTAKTALPAEQIMQYLMTVSDKDLDKILQTLAKEYATQYYAENASLFNSDPYKKVAAAFDEYVSALDEAALPALYDLYMPSGVSTSTLADNLLTLGVADEDSPSSIKFYVATFEAKDTLSEFIEAYNKTLDGDSSEITYTDYVGLIMSSVTVIVDAISYVLVAFVSVSLVVSSIMIGIITYISVLERTKEIGILRAIGASRRDISRVFNAETLVIGFAAGAFGIGISALLIIPINALIRALSGLQNIGAVLPVQAGVILVLISMGLTLIAGLLPSRLASKKDPVIALRTE